MSLCYRLLFILCLSLCPILETSAQSITAQRFSVTFFISPTCKICQYYALYMQELPIRFSLEKFTFRALMPGKHVTNEIALKYQSRYSITFPVSVDSLQEHKSMKATVTPEVFVTDKDGVVIYHGRIDDSYLDVGKRRSLVKNHELDEVLKALDKAEVVKVRHVPAVGCIIEKN